LPTSPGSNFGSVERLRSQRQARGVIVHLHSAKVSARSADYAASARIDVNISHEAILDELQPVCARRGIICWSKVFTTAHLRKNPPLDLAQRQYIAGAHFLARFVLVISRLLMRRNRSCKPGSDNGKRSQKRCTPFHGAIMPSRGPLNKV